MIRLTSALSSYDVISDGDLPKDVRDEILDCCPSNDCATIVNPEYWPKMKAWLIENQTPVKPYLIWWSW